MRHFYTAVVVLALAAFAAAQAPAPAPQEPTTQPPSETTPQQPQTPPSTIPDTQQDPAARPQSDTEVMVDDQTLQSQVHQQLSSDPAFRNVQVTVEEGKVRLEGTVASKEDKKRAKEMAKSMTGVKKVSNKLKVDEQMSMSGEAGAATGAETGAGAQTRPESDVTGETQPSTAPPSAAPQSTEPQTTQPSTEPSTTQPSTAPQSTYPQSAPETTQPQSEQTPGTTTQAGGDLKGQIEAAFKNEPTLTGTNVIVNVTETTVELSGSVPTGKERQTAKRIAQSYAGNRRVEDRMTVSGQGNLPENPPQTNQPNQTPPPPPPNF
jgi:osmotically-inducible protein OsmY